MLIYNTTYHVEEGEDKKLPDMDAGTLSSRGRKERNIVCSTYSPYS